MKILACIVASIVTASAALAATGSFRLGVAPVPPLLSASIAFEEPSGNKMLDADETGALVITVHNSGKGDAYDLVAEITASKAISHLAYDRELSIGTVPTGGQVVKRGTLQAGEELAADHERPAEISPGARRLTGNEQTPQINVNDHELLAVLETK